MKTTVQIRTNIVIDYPTIKGNIYTKSVYEGLVRNTKFPIKAMFSESQKPTDDLITDEFISNDTDMQISSLQLVNDEIVANVECNSEIAAEIEKEHKVVFITKFTLGKLSKIELISGVITPIVSE